MDLSYIIRNLYAAVPQGCTEEEIAAVRRGFGVLPQAVEDFWRTFGRTEELKVNQDSWCLPEQYAACSWLMENEDLTLLEENQDACQAIIRQEDLALPDPPVYIQEYGGVQTLSAPTVSEFLEAALTYEAIWQLPYASDTFYYLTEEEFAEAKGRLNKHTAVLRNWFTKETSFYSSRPDNLAVMMDIDGAYQCLYGGVTEESYAALLEVMEGLGEPL